MVVHINESLTARAALSESASERQIVRKAWGLSREIFREERIEMIRIDVRPGGFSSRHKHLAKHNGFLVVSGRLTVTCFDEDLPAEGILSAGDDLFVVPAGVEHGFFAGEGPVVAYEIYLAAGEAPVDPLDIQRRDVGGIRITNCSINLVAT